MLDVVGYYLAVTTGGYWLTIGNLSVNNNVTTLSNIGYGGNSSYYIFSNAQYRQGCMC